MKSSNEVHVSLYNNPEMYKDAVYYVQCQELTRFAFVSYEKALSFAERIAVQQKEVFLLCVPLEDKNAKPICLAILK